MLPVVNRSRTLFLLGVICVFSWMLVAATSPVTDAGSTGWMGLGYRPSAIAIACGGVATLLAAASPWRPLCGVAAVTWIGFGIARYTPQLEWVWASGFQTCLVATVAVGILLNEATRERLWIGWRSHRVWPKMLLALLAWTVITEVVARLGSDAIPGLKHHAVRMLESVVVLVLVFLVVDGPQSLGVVIAVAVGSLVSTVLQMSMLEGASDLAFAAAPLACLVCGITLKATFPVMVIGGLTSAALIVLSIATANRGANVGLVFGAAGLLMFSIRSMRTVVVVIGLVALICIAALNSPLRPRLAEWVDSGWQTATLASRIEFWRTSISLAPEHLIFGEGPGRGGQEMSEHLALHNWKATHNSALEMFNEQGTIGLLLWAGVIVAALSACRHGMRGSQPWMRGLGMATGCALVAMMVGALAVSRHDDIRLFWLLGLAFASGGALGRIRLERNEPN